MYSLDDLLHLVNSDRADALRLYVGAQPVILLDGQPHAIEGPCLTTEDTQQFLKILTNTRHRRELRANGMVRLIYRFRSITDFVVSIQNKNGVIDIFIK